MIIRDNIANKIGKQLSQYSSNKDAQVIMTYQAKKFLTDLIWIIALYFISVPLNIKNITFATFITFRMLRRCFAGFHLKNEYICLAASIFIIIFLSIIGSNISIDSKGIIAIYTFAYITALRLGVIDNEKKPLTDKRKALFKLQGIITLVIISIINICFYLKGNIMVGNGIAMGVILSFSNLYIAKIKSLIE